MTIRYLLVLGGSPERRAAGADPLRGVTGLSSEDLDIGILVSSMRSMLTEQGPWIVGDLFEGAAPATLPAAVKPDAARLIERYWGRYIAFWSDGRGGVGVLRDPSGAVPCYYRSCGELTLISSDLALLDLAIPVPRPLDWREIARILGAGDLRSPRTGIANLHELPPGHVLSIGDGEPVASMLWNPWRFAGQRAHLPFEDHVATLRERVEMVISALGQAHPHAVATVSGGLDSSIVALSLARVAKSLTCVTAATTDPSGDERRYARIVAEAGNIALEERLMDASDIDLGRSQVEHLPRPVGRPFFQSVARIVAETAKAIGASAVFNGTGGDNVFCFLQSATPIIDRFRAGSLIGAFRTARDVATMTNASYGDVAKVALRKLAASRQAYCWRDDRRFLSNDQAGLAAPYMHPWLQPPSGALPGHVAHVAMLLRVQNYLEPWRPGDPVDIVNPLLAQPIVELCLGIASWQWCRGGVDRAVARGAFADLLPATILQRSWKGGPDSFVGKLVDNNRSLIRDHLIGGLLDDQGLLDRCSLTAALANPAPFSASDALRILALTDAEAWVRHHHQA